MKTKLATTLSIVGVLTAGSAAALVNTQILDGSSESSASAAVLPPAAEIDLTVPSTTIDDEETDDQDETSTTTTSVPAPAPVSEAAAAAPAAAPAAPDVPSGEFLTAFSVGESGVVTVDVVNDRLILVNAEALPGWTVVDAEEDAPDHVEVTFSSATVLVHFEARFDGTTITPSVSSEAIPSASPAAGATGTTLAHRDDHEDDHDDEYEDDEYEEPEHEDDHDDERDDDHEEDHEDERDDD